MKKKIKNQNNFSSFFFILRKIGTLLGLSDWLPKIAGLIRILRIWNTVDTLCMNTNKICNIFEYQLECEGWRRRKTGCRRFLFCFCFLKQIVVVYPAAPAMGVYYVCLPFANRKEVFVSIFFKCVFFLLFLYCPFASLHLRRIAPMKK